MVELSYLFLVLISNILAALQLIANGGSAFVVLILCACICILYLFGYWFYLCTQNCGNKINSKITINVKRLHIFIFVLTLATLIFSLLTGVGVSEQDNRASGSQIFSLFNINSIFMLYYIVGRRNKRHLLYWINIVLYVVLRLSQGWSGILFNVFTYEAFFRLGKAKWNNGHRKVLYSLAIVAFIVVVGSLAYSFVSPLKYAIRYSDFSNINPLSFSEAMNNLLMRFSILPSAFRSINSIDKIIEIYQTQPAFAELQAMLRPLAPRTFMPFKEFYSMGSSIAAGISGTMNYNITDSVGIFIFALLLFKSSKITFIIWLLAYGLSFYAIYRVIKSIQTFPGEFKIFYYFTIFLFLETGNVETLFTQTYFKLIFFVPVFLLLGIIKIKKKDKRISTSKTVDDVGKI